MIARFSPRPEDLQHLQVGPIGPHLPSFATLVSQQGYSSVTGWLKVRLVAKLSRWLQQRRVPLSELNETQITAFFNARWKRLKRHVGDQTTMALLLRHLRQANVVSPPPEAGTGSDTDLLCAEYESFLLRERSLTPSSTENYLDVAHRFLFERFPTGKIYLKKLRAGDVTDFLLHDSANRGRRSVQLTATVLRSFLNFLFQKSRITTNLAPVVPSVPHRRLAEPPHYLDAAFITRFLDYLERERGNSARSRNVRLAAIHSFFTYVALHEPGAAAVAQRVLAIKSKRCAKKPVDFLTRAESDAVLAGPDQTTWSGRRDRTLLLVALQTGLRVSELVGLRCQDVVLETGAHVRCTGKFKYLRMWITGGSRYSEDRA
jgi:site-specific recombinase XerD